MNQGEVTLLIQASAAGDEDARNRLIEFLYADLRRIAGRMMRSEEPGHTLQATALVNELMIKMLGDRKSLEAENRQHLLCIAARSMRHLLVDHARGKRANKRGGGIKITLRPELAAAVESDERLLLIHDALNSLKQKSERQAKVAELRIFGGLSILEVAQALDISPRMVDRDWQIAKAWLRTKLM